jgi:signal transduction histidine kinase
MVLTCDLVAEISHGASQRSVSPSAARTWVHARPAAAVAREVAEDGHARSHPVGVKRRMTAPVGWTSRRVVPGRQSNPPLACADPVLLERVIATLLSKAVRYSPPGHPPVVTASAWADRVERRVIDRGHGLPEEGLERVFTPFRRTGDTAPQDPGCDGTGLGLALSRGLTEAVEGILVAEDTPAVA